MYSQIKNLLFEENTFISDAIDQRSNLFGKVYTLYFSKKGIDKLKNID